GGECTPLLSPNCTEVIGDYAAEDAIILGFMYRLTGSTLNQRIGGGHQCSLEYAHKVFTDNVGGLPNPAGGAARRVAVVICDTAADGGQARIAAAEHLVETVGVDGIIGPGFSDDVVDVTTSVTAPAGVLGLSPAAGAISLLGLQDNGLQWSVIMNDAGGVLAFPAEIGRAHV